MSNIIPNWYYQDVDEESGELFLRRATIDDLIDIMPLIEDLARKGAVGMKDITAELKR